jgi:hypothetical protein
MAAEFIYSIDIIIGIREKINLKQSSIINEKAIRYESPCFYKIPVLIKK